MMELQGALGLAQLKKLETVILPGQRQNKARITEALRRIEAITFRNIPDPEGDTATFLIFFLPTVEKAKAFNKVMTEEGVGAINWSENLWHYYEEWEHLLEGKSILPGGYPFKAPSGETRCRFNRSALPRTAKLLSRSLTIPISIQMDEQIPRILKAIEKAGKLM
jgi:8-amino-3,8-dideoxy-alpha-D-manno-octulosonate transaminase